MLNYPPNDLLDCAVTAEVSTPAGDMAIPEEGALVLTEGMAKGGYPVDIAAQSTVDLTSIGQSELECTSALIDPGLEHTAVAQLEVEYAVLGMQESFSEGQDFPPSITEVIQPMEMAELVDILPTLSLIEEETPSGPSTSSVMDMLESFGLGICESSSLFHLESPNLTSGAGCVTQPDVNYNSGSSGDNVVNSTGGEMPDLSWPFPPENEEALQGPSKGACSPGRGQAEWDRPSNSSS